MFVLMLLVCYCLGVIKMIGYIVLLCGVCVFSFGVLDNIFKINDRIDELEERWVFK